MSHDCDLSGDFLWRSVQPYRRTAFYIKVSTYFKVHMYSIVRDDTRYFRPPYTTEINIYRMVESSTLDLLLKSEFDEFETDKKDFRSCL